MSQSKGIFSITINDGTQTQYNTELFSLDQVFKNFGKDYTFPAGKCSGNHDVNFAPTLGRQIVVSFNDGSFTGWEPLPAQAINFVPSALESVSVGGFRGDQLFRVVGAGDVPESIAAWSVSNYDKLLDMIDDVTLVGGHANIGGTSSGFTGSLSGDVTGGQSSTKVVKLQNRDVLDSAPSEGQVLTWNHANSRWEPKAIPAAAAPAWTDITGRPTSLPPNGLATGDLTGSYPNPTIADNSVTGTKIADGGVAFSKITSGAAVTGQVLRFTTGTGWAPENLNFMDLVNSYGASPWPTGTCGVGEAIVWRSIADGFDCAPIAVTETDPKIGTNATNMLSKWDGTQLVASGVHESSGNVGIGTTSPNDKLDVAGRIRATHICAADGSNCKDLTVAWSAGSVTSVTGTAPIAVTGTAAAPVVSLNAGGVGNTHLATDAVTSAKIQDGSISAADIGDNQVTDVKISGVAVNKIASGAGLYLTYAPNNVSCAPGQVLKWTAANRWECGTDTTGSGTVTNVSSANTDIGVATGTTTPVLTLNSGTGANQILKLNGSSQIPAVDGSLLQNLSASNISSGTLPAGRLPGLTGDVTSTVNTNSTTVVRLQGRAIAATAPNNGQVLTWNQTNSQWEPVTQGSAGTVTSVSAAAPLTVTNATTTPSLALTNGTVTGQMLRWSGSAWVASTDGSALTALNAGNLTTGSIPAARIAADTITTTHISNGSVTAAKLATGLTDGFWTVNGANIGRASGNVGIGTTTPGQTLDVLGTIRGTSILVGANAVWHAGNFNPSSYQLSLGYTPVNKAGDTVTGNLGVNGSFLMSGNTVIDGSGGWHRTYGNTGWYSQTHGGGIFMQDATYVRVYGGKVFHSDNVIQSSTSMNAPAFYYTSDRRLKENIQPINGALDKVLGLNGVTFDWKESHKKDIGFIAQEVEQIAPELIGERPDPKFGTVKTVKYGNIVAIVIEAIKDLFKRSESQDRRIRALEIENEDLRATNRQVLERLNALERKIHKSSRGIASED
ncbi:MAG: tail fiber domain-containing protein [Bdellovibrionaceae bacterium]|nr:tail fiber domain-containing protein [Pseudobdellovibrionaceae bacterium]